MMGNPLRSVGSITLPDEKTSGMLCESSATVNALEITCNGQNSADQARRTILSRSRAKVNALRSVNNGQLKTGQVHGRFVSTFNGDESRPVEASFLHRKQAVASPIKPARRARVDVAQRPFDIKLSPVAQASTGPDAPLSLFVSGLHEIKPARRRGTFAL